MRNKNELEKSFGEIISIYSKQDAINDGYQHEVTKQAKEYGFKCPVYVTNGVYETLIVPENLKGIEDFKGRLHDLLYLCTLKLRAFKNVEKIDDSEDMSFFKFSVLFTNNERKKELKTFWCIFNEYEGFTIMYPEEY